nr:Hint domain-containing protein [Pseudoprimorskyibacter insulae]
MQRLTVYKSGHLRVINGANLGDAMCFADELILDDIYRLTALAVPLRLALSTDHLPPYRIGRKTETGQPGADVFLDAALTFMAGDGSTTECLLLVEVDPDGNAVEVYTMPLAPLNPDLDYALVGIDRDAALPKFAQSACVSFTKGTMITMSTGAQTPVEALKIGDRVLTRDNGPQEIRWIGQLTTRATGAFAPIVIKAGALHNLGDLVVSPDHRLFIYQRSDQLGAGRNELLVRARHLVNDDTVYVREGGYIDYYQMLFDHHQIIFAEGIAAESMLVDQRTSGALPEDMALRLTDLLPQHGESAAQDLEVQETLLKRPDAADLLRRSTCS